MGHVNALDMPVAPDPGFPKATDTALPNSV
jgi:hypothetical protein